MSHFRQRVYDMLSRVPPGFVVTYGDIARALSCPHASRAVGAALRANTALVVIPCHRVVKQDGTLGGYVRGVQEKKRLLKKEGVHIVNDVIDLSLYRYVL